MQPRLRLTIAAGGTDRAYATVLILLGLGWTGFHWLGCQCRRTTGSAIGRYSDAGFVRCRAADHLVAAVDYAPVVGPGADAAICAGRGVAARSENALLQQSVAALAEQLESARTAMRDQGQSLQQHGLDAAKRMHDSSSKLSASVERIVTANASLSQSGETAMQRMDGFARRFAAR